MFVGVLRKLRQVGDHEEMPEYPFNESKNDGKSLYNVLSYTKFLAFFFHFPLLEDIVY